MAPKQRYYFNSNDNFQQRAETIQSLQPYMPQSQDGINQDFTLQTKPTTLEHPETQKSTAQLLKSDEAVPQYTTAKNQIETKTPKLFNNVTNIGETVPAVEGKLQLSESVKHINTDFDRQTQSDPSEYKDDTKLSSLNRGTFVSETTSNPFDFKIELLEKGALTSSDPVFRFEPGENIIRSEPTLLRTSVPISPEIASKVMETVSQVASERRFPIEIALDPPELGTVRISISSQDTGVHYILHAERPETLDLMRRNAHMLFESLGERPGVQVNISFSGQDLHSSGSRSGHSEGAPQQSLPDDTQADPAQTLNATPLTQSTTTLGQTMTGRLDMRL